MSELRRRVHVSEEDGELVVTVTDLDTGTEDWRCYVGRTDENLSRVLRDCAHYLDVTRSREPVTHSQIFLGMSCSETHRGMGWCAGYSCQRCGKSWPCGPAPTDACVTAAPEPGK